MNSKRGLNNDIYGYGGYIYREQEIQCLGLSSQSTTAVTIHTQKHNIAKAITDKWNYFHIFKVDLLTQNI